MAWVGAVRLSFHLFNSCDDVDRLLRAMETLL
jgi:selenocysteine lyase/cysteine desulfurase